MIGIPQSKSHDWEIRDLLDGRIGVFHKGLCIRVFYSMEELNEWTRAVNPIQTIGNEALNRAIRRL